MADDTNRRKHVRLEMTEDAIAVDDHGKEIGRVLQAGGGGMTVESKTEEIASRLRLGQKIRVTILEPQTQTRNTIDVVVRRNVGRQIGFEFVTGNPAT